MHSERDAFDRLKRRAVSHQDVRVQVRRLEVQGFLLAAGEFLRSREAEHNLLLGLAGRLTDNAKLYGEEDPYFAVVEDADRVVAAALRTPPYNLVLSESEDTAAFVALAENVHTVFDRLPGVIGPTAGVAVFNSAWASLSGDGPRLLLSQRIYEATEVSDPRQVDGRMRGGTGQDHDLLLRWIDAFAQEAMPEGAPGGDGPGLLERRAADPDGGWVLWDDHEPVSLAGYGNATPNGIRIGPVYTPPELRGRGYASALVAAVTRQLLSTGRDFCFLFTDLANPTSNSIYQQVGYRPVADVEQWTFERPD
jgi:predicted GNAT family acetyltransferase